MEETTIRRVLFDDLKNFCCQVYRKAGVPATRIENRDRTAETWDSPGPGYDQRADGPKSVVWNSTSIHRGCPLTHYLNPLSDQPMQRTASCIIGTQTCEEIQSARCISEWKWSP